MLRIEFLTAMLLAVDWQVPGRNCAPGNSFLRYFFQVACYCHILPQTYISGRSMTQHERNTPTPVFLVLRHPWISNHLPYTSNTIGAFEHPPVLRFPNCCQPTRRLKHITTNVGSRERTWLGSSLPVSGHIRSGLEIWHWFKAKRVGNLRNT